MLALRELTKAAKRQKFLVTNRSGARLNSAGHRERRREDKLAGEHNLTHPKGLHMLISRWLDSLRSRMTQQPRHASRRRNCRRDRVRSGYAQAEAGVLDVSRASESLETRALLSALDNVGTADDVIFELPTGETDAILENLSAVSGWMQLRSQNSGFTTFQFPAPSNSLTLRGGDGMDTVTIDSVDPSFDAHLIVDGIALGADQVDVTWNAVSSLSGSFSVDASSFVMQESLEASGDISVTTDEALQFSSSVSSTGGNIDLVTQATFRNDASLHTDGGSLNVEGTSVGIFADIDTAGGAVSVLSTGDVQVGADISTVGGEYFVTADSDGDGTGIYRQGVAAVKNGKQFSFTAEYLNENATFLSPKSLVNNDTTLLFPQDARTVDFQKLFEIELAAAGELSGTTSYAVDLEVDSRWAWTQDNDLKIGLSDGTDVVAWMRLDNAASQFNYIDGEDGDTLGNLVSITPDSGAAMSGTEFPAHMKLSFVLDPTQTTLSVRGNTTQRSAHHKAQRTLNAADGLKLVAFADGTNEAYEFFKIDAEITEQTSLNRTMDAPYLENNASFVAPHTVSSNGTGILFGTRVESSQKLLEIPFAAAGQLSADSSYTVELNIDARALTADNDPYFGISDGTTVLAWGRADVDNSAESQLEPWLLTDGDTFSNSTRLFPHGGITDVSNTPEQLKLSFRLDPGVHTFFARDNIHTETAHDTTSERPFNVANELKLVMFSGSYGEEYEIFGVEVEVTENSRFDQPLTAAYLENFARFVSPHTIEDNNTTLNFTARPNTHQKLFEIDLVDSGVLSAGSTYVVDLAVDTKAISSDNDLRIGLSDGTDFVALYRLDGSNPDQLQIAEGTDSDILGGDVITGSPNSGSVPDAGSTAEQLQLSFVLDAGQSSLHARTNLHSESVHHIASRVINVEDGLKIVLFNGNYDEHSELFLVDAEVRLVNTNETTAIANTADGLVSIAAADVDLSAPINAGTGDVSVTTLQPAAPISLGDENEIIVSTPIDIVDGNTSSVAALFDSSGADGAISLREAITAANNTSGQHTIVLGAGTYTLSISGSDEDDNITGDLDILGDLVIRGEGARTTVIDANDVDRIFHVVAGGTLDVSGISITDGHAPSYGGGIMNQGALTANEITFANNMADLGGGGLANLGPATIISSTFADNSAPNGSGDGGAIFNFNGATISVANTTFSGNSVADSGGAIRNNNGSTVNLSHVTISGNGIDIYNSGSGVINADNSILNQTHSNSTPVTDLGFNILGSGGVLGPLQNNGGPTDTRAPVFSHSAVDGGDPTSMLVVDQRGYARPEESRVDIGAFEYNAVPATPAVEQVSFRLSDAELNLISTTGEIRVGDGTSGDVTIVGPIGHGTAGTLHIASGATISDTNVIGTDITSSYVTFDGNVVPGSSPGLFSVDGSTSLSDDSTFTVELGGTAPGNGSGFHDQLAVSGIVDIGESVSLHVSSVDGFIPAVNHSFTIVARSGGSGTFAGLPEGAIVGEDFLGSGRTAWISYTGGLGNDVVVTVSELDSLSINATISEGDTAILTGTFPADGPLDTQEVVIDWGDGTTTNVVPIPPTENLTLLAVSDRDGVDSDLDGTFDTLDAEVDFDLSVRRYVDRDSRAAMEFELTNLPLAHVVDSAVLSFVGFSIAGAPQVEIEIHGYVADGGVTVDDLTVSNLIAGPIQGTNSEIQSQMANIDVTSYVQSLVEQGATHVGFTVLQKQQGGGVTLSDFQDRISLKLSLTGPPLTFSAMHVYSDDDPTDTPADSFVVTVSDAQSSSVLGVTSLVVNNAAPSITSISATSVVDENEIVTLSGTFDDVGLGDTHSIVVDWGEGTPQIISLAPGSREFSIAHRYLNDATADTIEGIYPIHVELRDDDTGLSTEATTTTVRNVAPAITNLQLDSTVLANGIATLTGTFVDPGTEDTFTLNIDWGDPASGNNTEAITYPASVDGIQSFTLSHDYDTPGEAIVTLTLTDSDGGTTTATDSILVLDQNSPTDILLSNTSILENSLPGAVIGTLSAVDSDPGDEHIFQLIDDSQGWFEIVNNELRITSLADLDFEASTVHQVTVLATDLTGLSFAKTLDISVADLPEDVSDITIGGFLLFNVEYSNGGSDIEGEANLPFAGVVHLSGTVVNGDTYDVTATIGDMTIGGFSLTNTAFNLINSGLSLTADADLPLAGAVQLSGNIIDGNNFEFDTPPLSLSVGGYSLTGVVVTLAPNGLSLSGTADLPVVGTVSLDGTVVGADEYSFTAPLPTLAVGDFSLTNVTVTFDETGLSLDADANLPVVGQIDLNGDIQSVDDYTFSTPLSSIGVGDFSLQNTEIVLSAAGLSATGAINVPVFGDVELAGNINADGTYSITAIPDSLSLLSGLVNFDSILLTLTDQAITVEADATVAEVGFANFEGSLFADGSYLLEAEAGINLAGFVIDGVNLTLGTEQLDVGFDFEVPEVGSIGFSGSYFPNGDWSLTGSYPGIVTIGPIVVDDITATITNSSLGFTAQATVAGLEAFADADMEATIYFDGRFEATVDADVLDIGGFSLANADVFFGNTTPETGQFNPNKAFLLTIDAQAGIPGGGPNVDLSGFIDSNGNYGFSGAQSLELGGVTLAGAEFSLNKEDGFTVTAQADLGFISAAISGTIGTGGNIAVDAKLKVLGTDLMLSGDLNVSSFHLEREGDFSLGGFNFGSASFVLDSVTGFEFDAAIGLAGFDVIVDGKISPRGQLVDLTASADFPVLNSLSLKGYVNGPRDFNLTVKDVTKPIKGFSLSNMTIALSSAGLYVAGGLNVPLITAVRLEGWIRSASNFSLAVRNKAINVKGFSLPSVDIILSNAGLSIQGRANLPFLGGLDVSGDIWSNGRFRINATQKPTKSLAGFRLPSITASLSETGLFIASKVSFAPLPGALNITGYVSTRGAFDLKANVSNKKILGFKYSGTVTFSSRGILQLDGNFNLPFIGSARLKGRISSNGNFNLQLQQGIGGTRYLTGSGVNAMPLSNLNLQLVKNGSYQRLAVSGRVGLPFIGSVSFKGYVASNRTFSLTVQGRSSWNRLGVGFNAAVTIRHDGIRVNGSASLPFGIGSVSIDGTITNGNYRFSTTLYGGRFFGYRMPSLSLSLTNRSVYVQGAVSLPFIGGNVTLRGYVSSSGFDLKAYSNKSFLGLRVKEFRLTNSSASIRVYIPSIGSRRFGLSAGSWGNAFGSLSRSFYGFQLKEIAITASGTFFVQVESRFGNFSLGGRDLSKLQSLLRDRIPGVRIDGPRVGGYAGQAGNKISSGFKSAKKKWNGTTAGSFLFFDANFDGVHNYDVTLPETDPRQEPWTFINNAGLFLGEVSDVYDLNANGTLDNDEGQWVALGGLLTATGITAENVQVAPATFDMMTPLTTIVSALMNRHGVGVDVASAMVVQAFSLNSVDLAIFDPQEEILSGNADGAEVYIRHALVANLTAAVSSLITDSGGPPKLDVSRLVTAELADRIFASPGSLDLASLAFVESVIQNVAGSAATSLPAELELGAAQVIAAGNQRIAALMPTADFDFVETAERIKATVQGSVSNELGAAARGDLSVSELILANTGIALTARIQSVVLPPTLLVPDVVEVEATSAQGAVAELVVSANEITGQPLSTSLSHPSGNLFPLGDTVVTASANSTQSGQVVKSFTVTVVDTTPPDIFVEDLIAEATGADGAFVSFESVVTVADLVDDSPEIGFDLPPGLFPIGETVVTATATDDSGNSLQTTFLITVVDTTPPELSMTPEDIVVVATDLEGAFVDLPDFSATDTVDSDPAIFVDYEDGHFAVGMTEVTVVAFDDFGNTAFRVLTVTVLDTVAPEILIPANLTIESLSPEGVALDTIGIEVTDNIDGTANLEFDVAIAPLGTSAVTATATDSSGNSTSVIFDVTVVDTVAPVLQSPLDILVEADEIGGASVTFATVEFIDFGDIAPEIMYDVAPGFFPIGETEITVTATDTSGNSDSFVFVVMVEDTIAPTISKLTNVVVVADDASGAFVTLPELVVSDAGDESPAVLFGAESGIFPIGSTVVSVTATDAGGNTSLTTFTITVVDPARPAPVPIIVDISDANREGAVVTVIGDVISSNSLETLPNIDYRWEAFKEGESAAFATNTGFDFTQFVFTPDDSGLYDIVLTVDDGTTSEVTATQIFVQNVAPVVSLNYEIDHSSGSPIVLLTGTAADVSSVDEGNGLTFSLEILKGESTFTTETNETGQFQFASDGIGDYRAILTVVDKDGSATNAETALNFFAPIATDMSFEVDEDALLTALLPVLNLDSDLLTYQLVDAPQHGTLVFHETGLFSYEPNENFNGSDSFSFNASDDFSTSQTATVEINVVPVGDAPRPEEANFTGMEDSLLTGFLSATDIDGENLTYLVVDEPSNGTLWLNPDGSFDYEPNDDFFGDDEFTFTAEDGQVNEDLAVVSLSIAGVNDAPQIDEPFLLFTEEDAPVASALIARDVDSDETTFRIVEAAAHGTVDLFEDGSFTYTPAPSYFGEDQFIVVANDGVSDSTTATVSISVEPIYNAGPDRIVNEGEPLVASFDSVGGDFVTIDWGDGLIEAVFVDEGTGNIEAAHVFTENGMYQATVVVVLEDGTVVADGFEVLVGNLAPSLSIDTIAAAIYEGSLISKAITTSDVSADTVSVTASIGTITDNGGGSWTWNYDGTDDLVTTSVTITARDEDGGLTSASFDLTVNNVAPSLTVNPVAIVIDEGSSASRAITTSDVPADTVTVAASIGTITDNDEGIWTWNYDGNDDLTTTSVTITATDEDGGLTSASFDITVSNVVPSSLVLSLADNSIDEDSTAVLSGTFIDPGLRDSHQIEIDWDDLNAASNSVFDVNAISTEDGSLQLMAGDVFPSLASGASAVLTIESVNELTGQIGFTVEHYFSDDSNSNSYGLSRIAVSVRDIDASGNGGTVYESATIGATGQTGGVSISTTNFAAVRFEVLTTTSVDQVGGHFGLRTGSDIFAAIVRLTDSTDVPDSPDLSTPDVVATTTIVPPNLSADVTAPISATLTPGFYSLVFGSGLFGTFGRAIAANTNTDIGSPSFFFRDEIGNYSEQGSPQVRFFVGSSTQEATASIDLTVNNLDPSLTIDPTPVVIGEGSSVSRAITTSDVPADTVSVAASVGTITDNGSGSWAWSYDGADDLATTSVTIIATDEDGGLTSASFDLTVNNVDPTPSIDSVGTLRQEGTTILFMGTATDPAGFQDTLTYVWDFGDGGAQETGTSFGHTYSEDGTYTVTLTVSDEDGGTATVSETIEVLNTNPVPSIVSISADRREGVQVEVSASAYDAGGANDPLTYGYEVFKDGSTTPFASLSGFLQTGFNFTPDDNGSYEVILTVSDDDGGSAAASQTIVVDNVDPALVVDSSQVVIDEGTSISKAITTSDVPADTVSVSASIGTIIDNGSGSWTWSYDGTDDVATTSVTISSSDEDGGLTSAAFDLTVNNVDPTLTVDPSDVVIDEGNSTSKAITTSDVAADTVSVSASIGTITDSGGGSWTWNYDGTDDLATTSVTITATDEDGGLTSTAFDLTVNNVDPTLTVHITSLNIDEGTSTSKAITTSDVPADTVSVTASIGTITNNGSGSWTWNYEGIDDLATTSVTITATDEDGGLASASFELTVANVAPTANADVATVGENGAGISIDVLSNDTDPAGVLDPLSVIDVDTAGTIGLVVFTASGVAYDPNGQFESLAAGETATDSFTYTISDGDGGTSTATAVVTITGSNDAPEIVSLTSSSPDFAQQSTDGNVTVSGTFSDMDLTDIHAVTIDWGDGAALEVFSVDQLADTFTGGHLYADGGNYTITATLDDGNGGSDTLMTTAVVQGIGLVDGILYINGTDGRDWIEVNQHGGTLHVSAWLNKQGRFWYESYSHEHFNPADVDAIVVIAGDHHDVVQVRPSSDIPVTVDAGGGNDWVRTAGGDDTVFGGDGNDDIATDGGNDTIDAGEGHNWVDAGDGRNTIAAGTGSDVIWSGNGQDTIDAGDGNNLVHSGGGLDTITTGNGNDCVHSGDGDDVIHTGAGNDWIDAGRGNDVIYAGAGNDDINAGRGNDIVFGGSGNDWIDGGKGSDLLFGGDGNDCVKGGDGRDILIGGDGRDNLRGGRGNDLLIGGEVDIDWEDALDPNDLDDALAEWATGDLADTMSILGNVVDDDERDWLFGEQGHDTLIGGNGDRRNW